MNHRRRRKSIPRKAFCLKLPVHKMNQLEQAADTLEIPTTRFISYAIDVVMKQHFSQDCRTFFPTPNKSNTSHFDNQLDPVFIQ
jgi:hypothetical protein